MSEKRTRTRARLETSIMKIEGVTAELKNDLWSVFAKYYDSVTREMFESDLQAKTHIIVLRDSESDRVCGFSTVELYFREHEGRRIQILYSGDTIVEKEYWGQKDLHKAFFKLIMLQKLKHPLTPFYWFLISKGYKTYLLLAKYFVNFWPRPQAEFPDFEFSLLNTISLEKFNEAWNPDSGLLKFQTCLGKLKHGIAPITEKDLADEHIRFFQEKNPSHAHGDELCCLGRIDSELAVAFSKKLFLGLPKFDLSSVNPVSALLRVHFSIKSRSEG